MLSERSRLSRWQSVAETLSLLVVAAAVAWLAVARAAPPSPPAGAGVAARRPAPPVPTEPISLAGTELLGKRTARVGLVIYSDFQCPFCARFATDTLPGLQRKYVKTGKVRLAFRQFPLPIHAQAQKAAEAAVCAGRQGQFWPYHDLLFANPQALDETSLLGRASSLGLDQPAFATCLRGEVAAAVRADYAGGAPLGVTGTPTFLAGPIVDGDRLRVTHRFSGALPIAQFEAVLDQVLGAAAKAAPGTR